MWHGQETERRGTALWVVLDHVESRFQAPAFYQELEQSRENLEGIAGRLGATSAESEIGKDVELLRRLDNPKELHLFVFQSEWTFLDCSRQS